jgi:hypothetical protein
MDTLPGWELVDAGIRDLAAGRETTAGELVRSVSKRLSELGLVPRTLTDHRRPDRLYELIADEVGPRAAHARYNALRRRMTSFLRAAGHARTR